MISASGELTTKCRLGFARKVGENSLKLKKKQNELRNCEMEKIHLERLIKHMKFAIENFYGTEHTPQFNWTEWKDIQAGLEIALQGLIDKTLIEGGGGWEEEVAYLRKLADREMTVIPSNSFDEPPEYIETEISAALHNAASTIVHLSASPMPVERTEVLEEAAQWFGKTFADSAVFYNHQIKYYLRTMPTPSAAVKEVVVQPYCPPGINDDPMAAEREIYLNQKRNKNGD